MSIQDPINWIGLVLFCLLILLTAMSLYQAWVNLMHQKVSRFSLDALLAYISQRVRARGTKNNIRGFPKDKTDIIVLGVLALLAGLKGIQEIISLADKYKP